MTNTADALVEILLTLATPARTATRSHREKVLAGKDFWAEHRRISAMIDELRDIAGQLEHSGRRVDHYQRALDEATRALWLPNAKWDAGSQGKMGIGQATVDVLRSMSDAIDGWGLQPVLSLDTEHAIREKIRELKELLNASDMQVDTVRNLISLLDEAEQALAEHTTNSVTRIAQLTQRAAAATLRAVDRHGGSGAPRQAPVVRVAAWLVLAAASGFAGAAGADLYDTVGDAMSEVRRLEGGSSSAETDAANPEPGPGIATSKELPQ